MDPQSDCTLPLASLSLSFAPAGVAAPRIVKPQKVAVPSGLSAGPDGPRSHPISASDRLASAPEPACASRPPHRKADSGIERIVAAIPAALSRLVTAPAQQGPFTGPASLSDIRVFPSAVPRRSARGGSGRPAGGAARGPVLVWFRNDLRLHDQPALARACREGSSVVPVYVFDPRDYEQAPGGFPRIGPARARFLLESLADLRGRLRGAGSELVVARGLPEEVLPALAESVGAGAVYCCAEVTAEEAQVESRVRAALERRGCELRAEWGGTLFQPEDLPFRLDAMPGTYAEFRSRLAGRAVRAPLDSEGGVKGLPAGFSAEPGKLPTLQQLGFPPAASPSGAAAGGGTGGGGAASLSAVVGAGGPVLRGGEGEALRHLQAFMAELKASVSKAQQPAGGPARPGAPSAGGAASPSSAFSCRISPWLALGCLSPRRMYHEMRAQLGGGGGGSQLAPAQPSGTARQAAGAGAGSGGGAGGGSPANWLMFELLWRDFFRFMSQKYTASARTAQARAARAAAGTASVAAVPASPALALAAA